MDHNCSICIDSIGTKTSCGHYICKECVGNLRKFCCPMCRDPNFESPFLTDELKDQICIRFNNDMFDYEENFAYSDESDSNESDELELNEFNQSLEERIPFDTFKFITNEYESDFSDDTDENEKDYNSDFFDYCSNYHDHETDEKFIDFYSEHFESKTTLFEEERMCDTPFDYLENDDMNEFFIYFDHPTFKELLEKFPIINKDIEFQWSTDDGYHQSFFINNLGPNKKEARQKYTIDLGYIDQNTSEIDFYKRVSLKLCVFVFHPFIYSREFINTIKFIFEKIKEESIEYNHEYHEEIKTKRQTRRERKNSKIIKS